MSFLGFLLLGLIAGAIAKLILPGKQGGGWLITLVLGVVGALLGGWLGSVLFGVELGSFFNLTTWLLAIAKHVLGDEMDRRNAQKRGSSKKAMELDESWMMASNMPSVDAAKAWCSSWITAGGWPRRAGGRRLLPERKWRRALRKISGWSSSSASSVAGKAASRSSTPSSVRIASSCAQRITVSTGAGFG